MFVKQLYTGCLSEAAYYVESNGEAAIIDPLRDIEAYLQLASERGSTIRYIFETHLHADFVSGHIDLAKATGATIIYGPDAKLSFDVHVSKDKEVFELGNVTITALHTPGHSLESTCYLLKDASRKDYCVFTGDTLFVGDVGRPDLAQKAALLSMEDLASLLYTSLQQKIIPLADEVIVYPGHGPGSACGKSLGPNTTSTIGTEKSSNYALQATTKEAFITAVTEGLTPPPAYFPLNAKLNREGYESLDSVLDKGLQPLSVAAVKEAMRATALLLDTRPATLFTQGFIPGSIFIGLEGRFSEWAGSLLSFKDPIVLLTEEGKEKETVVRLARVGFSNMIGFVSGGLEAWQAAGETTDLIIDVEADELAMDMPFDPQLVVVDVRKPAEFGDGHVKDAINLPLGDMVDPALMANIDDDQNLYLHCAGGYRSVVAASMLKRQGFHNLRNVVGGWAKIKEQPTIETEKEKSVLN